MYALKLGILLFPLLLLLDFVVGPQKLLVLRKHVIILSSPTPSARNEVDNINIMLVLYDDDHEWTQYYNLRINFEMVLPKKF